MFDSNFLNGVFIVEPSQDLADVLDSGRCVICGGLGGWGSVNSRMLNSRLPVCCVDHERLAGQLGERP